MVKLYMNENVFSVFEEFWVKDESGRNRYRVTGVPLALTKKINIHDERGKVVASIIRPFFSFLRDTYDIYVGGKKRAVVHKRLFTFFPWNKHQVGIVNWDVNGSLLDHDYTLMKGFGKIASIHKKWMSFGDCYELHVDDEKNELIALAVAISLNAIDADHRIPVSPNTEKK